MRNYLSALILFCSFASFAQYQSAVGLRVAERGIGLNYNYYLSADRFIQIDGLGRSGQELVGGLAMVTYNFHEEIHNSMLHTTKLFWTWGAGLHAGKFWDPDNKDNENHFVFGPDIRLSVEYMLPFNLSIGGDFVPYYNVAPRFTSSDLADGWLDSYLDFGVYLRYVID